MAHYESLAHVNKLFGSIGLPVLSAEDVDLLNEYMLVMQPLALVVDIVQGEKKVFYGLGLLLPLLSKLKLDLGNKEFSNVGAIRNKILTSIDKRYSIVIFYLRLKFLTSACFLDLEIVSMTPTTYWLLVHTHL